jgi:hypothetical protein
VEWLGAKEMHYMPQYDNIGLSDEAAGMVGYERGLLA